MERNIVQQALLFGSVHREAPNEQPVPYFLAGPKLYTVGTTNGALEAIGAEHLVGDMGGVWAHPVKFLDGWYVAIEDGQGRADLLQCTRFEGHLSDATLHFEHAPLQLQRTDVVHDEHAALFSLLTITNTASTPWHGTLSFAAQVNIVPTWFGGWERGTMRLEQEYGLVVAYDDLWQGRWGVAFGSSSAPAQVEFGRHNDKPTAKLRYDLQLAPGERRDLEFVVACDHQNGHHGALHLLRRLVGQGAELLERKRERYRQAAFDGVELHTPDAEVNNDWVLAKVNLHMLQADYGPYLPGYFLAGIPEYPNLFGCDNTYTAPGATAAGFAATVRDTLSLLGDYARRACGRVPHEVTTNARVFNPGNTQETPQFAIAVWEHVRWTGDLAFLRLMYPLCREGVLSYLPAVWGGGNTGYPMGDAMVERTGMGSMKLDSACYLYAAWQALAAMAQVLERPEAAQYHRKLDDWRDRFERDWWMPERGMYADSLHSDGRRQFDGHWTQVVPIQLGVAQADRAEQVLNNIERELTNQWGLIHTQHEDERVWTLPTGLLALAAARYGRADDALRMLNNIAHTARTGMLGAFKELIPEGLCFMQLWSAGLYVQGMVEGLLGLHSQAHLHRLHVAPALPQGWPFATLRNLEVGAHQLHLHITPTTLEVEHASGPQPLEISFRPAGATGAGLDNTDRIDIHGTPLNGATATLPVGETTTIVVHDGVAQVEYGRRPGGGTAAS